MTKKQLNFTTNEVNNLLDKINNGEVLTTDEKTKLQNVDLSKYATKSYVDDAIANIDVGTEDGSGNTNVTIQGTLNNCIYVKDFGAIGDNSTDDKNAIQSAIDAASASGMQLVFEKNKTYRVSGNIKIYSNTHIDLNRSTIRLASNSNCPIFQNIDGWNTPTDSNLKENISICNGTIDGNSSSNKSDNLSGMLLSLFHGKNLEFKNLIIKYCYRNPINLFYVENVIIENVEFYHIGDESGGYSVSGGNYAISMETNSAGAMENKNIFIRNVKYDTGMGGLIHCRNTMYIDIANVEIINAYDGGESTSTHSIGITFTKCEHVKCDNVYGEDINLHLLEINHSCNNIFVSNMRAKDVERAIVIGANGANNTVNNNITIDNLIIEHDNLDLYTFVVNFSENVTVRNFKINGRCGGGDYPNKNIQFINGYINTYVNGEYKFGGTLLKDEETILKDVIIDTLYCKHYQKNKYSNFVFTGSISAGSSVTHSLGILRHSCNIFGKLIIKSYKSSSQNTYYSSEYDIYSYSGSGSLSSKNHSFGDSSAEVTPRISNSNYTITLSSSSNVNYIVEII